MMGLELRAVNTERQSHHLGPFGVEGRVGAAALVVRPHTISVLTACHAVVTLQ